MQRTDAEYTRTAQHRLQVLAKAIKASGGDMQTPIVVGALPFVIYSLPRFGQSTATLR